MSRSCPLGHTCDQCHWQVQLRGIDPTSGQEIDKTGCAIAHLPILMIENSQQQRQTAAAVESARNAFAHGTDKVATVLGQGAQLLVPVNGSDLELEHDQG